MDVAAWLRDLGLERYVSAFRDNDIDAEVLPKLTSVSRRRGAPLDISTWLREPASGATMNWITMWRAISAHILSLGEAGNYLLQAFQANEGNYGGVNLVLRELEQIGRELQAFLNEYESY